MAAPLALVEVQLIAQAGDTAALIAQRPVLLDGAQDVVQAMELMTSSFLRWEAAPDGRRRVSAIGDFLSAFVSASVLTPAAREQRLDLRVMALHPLVQRMGHLVTEKSLELRPYEGRRDFVKAVRAATLQHRGAVEMVCDAAAGFEDCEAYQAFQEADVGNHQPQMDADDIVEAEFMRRGRYYEGVDEFNIPDVLSEYYYYFGGTTTRAMRITEGAQFRMMAVAAVDTLVKASAIPVPNIGAQQTYDHPMAFSAIMQWLRDCEMPVQFDNSSLSDRLIQRAMQLQRLVQYCSGSSSQMETVVSKGFATTLRRLSTLSQDRWLGKLSGSEAFAEYGRLAKSYFPDESNVRWNTMHITEAAVAGDVEVWDKPSLQQKTGAALVSELVRLREANAEVVKGTAKKGGSDPDQDSDSLNPSEMKICMKEISSSFFERHAARIERVENSDLSPELKSMAVLHAAMGVPRRPDDTVDESEFHILIPQNIMKPRLNVAHHKVFGILDYYRDEMPRYLTQFAMFGPDLGATAENPQHKLHKLDQSVTDALMAGEWDGPDYLNDVEARLQALLDECDGEAYPVDDQYIVKTLVDDIRQRLGRLHEALGINPKAPFSTNHFIDEQLKSIKSCRNYPSNHRGRIDALHQSSFTGLLAQAGGHWYKQMKSKNALLKMDRSLGAAGKAIYEASLKSIQELLVTMKPLLRLDPEVLQRGGQIILML